MVPMVADAELLLDDLGDAGAGPDPTPEAVSLRPVPEELWDQSLLLRRQPTVAAWSGVGTKSIRATPFSSGKPLADGWPRDAKSLGDGPLRPAFMLQAQRPHPPPLLPVPECREGGVHTSFYGPEQLSRFAQRSVSLSTTVDGMILDINSEFVNQSPLQNICEATDGLTLFRVTSCVDSVHANQCTNDEFFTASQ